MAKSESDEALQALSERAAYHKGWEDAMSSLETSTASTPDFARVQQEPEGDGWEITAGDLDDRVGSAFIGNFDIREQIARRVAERLRDRLRARVQQEPGQVEGDGDEVMGWHLECPECEDEGVVGPESKVRFCGLCAGDNGRDVKMRRRPLYLRARVQPRRLGLSDTNEAFEEHAEPLPAVKNSPLITMALTRSGLFAVLRDLGVSITPEKGDDRG